MPRTWTKTEAFAHFGTTLTNARWSWSGIAPDGSVVALVLRQDVVKGRDGRLTYFDDEGLDAEWRKRPGHTERVRHLVRCRNALEGRFRAVIARAVVPITIRVRSRHVIRMRECGGSWMTLTMQPEPSGRTSTSDAKRQHWTFRVPCLF